MTLLELAMMVKLSKLIASSLIASRLTQPTSPIWCVVTAMFS